MSRRKAFCTLAFGAHAELLEIGRPTIEEYCTRHGYDLVIHSEQRTDLPPSWEKIPIVRELLDDYAEVMWMDADAVIVDASEDIFDALAPDRGVGMVMHVNLSLLPNAGVLALRSIEPTLALLDDVWGLRDRYREHAWWEQAALCEALGFATIGSVLRLVAPSRHMLAVEFLATVWNSIALEYTPNAKIKHYPSTPHARRTQLMRRDLAIAAQAQRPRKCDMSAVLMLHGCDVSEVSQLLQALSPLAASGSVQMVLVTPDGAITGLEPLLGQAEKWAQVVRAGDSAEDALLEALTVLDGRVLLFADGPVPVTDELARALVDFVDANPEVAIVRQTEAGQLIVCQHQRLPRAGWFVSAEEPRPPFMQLRHALEVMGARIID